MKDSNLDRERQDGREDMERWEKYLRTGKSIPHEKIIAWLSDLVEGKDVSSPIPETEPWIDPVGAWSDLPDTILEDLDELRHATPPTLPIQEL